jgi:hypothetical protein
LISIGTFNTVVDEDGMMGNMPTNARNGDLSQPSERQKDDAKRN